MAVRIFLTGKGVRHVKLRGVADVMRPGVKKLIAEAARLNKKDPPSGMMVEMEKRKVSHVLLTPLYRASRK